jgi:ATP-dependent DNA ligase
MSPILLSMSSALHKPERVVRRFERCLTRPAKKPPAGPGWIHEIKHDGFRIVAHRDGDGVRLITRNGFDFADRFPLIVESIAALPARSCVLDGEAIAVDANGLSVFDLIRCRQHDHAVNLCAFDLLELDGEDLRRTPLELRKARSRGCCAAATRAWRSISISRPMAIRSIDMLVRSAVRVLFRSGSDHRIGRAAPIIGSR